jgi:hypothetical protein
MRVPKRDHFVFVRAGKAAVKAIFHYGRFARPEKRDSIEHLVARPRFEG